MGLDQPVLQWLFNVVMITGFAGLVVLCYVLKQDNKKLTLELAHGQLRQKHSESTVTRCAVPPLEHQDIRHFVARRSHDWLAVAR